MLVGCNDRPPLGEGLSGRVIVEGNPLDDGLITLIPNAGTTGNKISTVVQAGNYQILPEDGLNAGSFRVEILGLSPSIKAMADGKRPTIGKDSYREIDERFNEKSELQCDVVAGLANVADFHVQYSKP